MSSKMKMGVNQATPPIQAQHAGFGVAGGPTNPQVQQQPQHPQIDPDLKRVQDLIESISLITNIRDDVNTILENVGKTNPSLHALTVQTQSSETGETIAQIDATGLTQNIELRDVEFLEKTDNKYLVEKVVDINRCISELEKLIGKDPQPFQLFNYPLPDFNAILLDQMEDKVSSHKLLSNYRWFQKFQESINFTSLMPYKRFSQPYSEKKSTKYKTNQIKPLKRDELEKFALQIVSPINNQDAIKILVAQKSEHEFVLDMIMPQNFKFVILLFDLNVEKLQVRPIDSRMLKIYQTNKQRAEDICYFDFEHKNTSNVFHRLEQNCLLACVHFKTEQGPSHFKYILNWLKNYVNLFNAKCAKCEKHLLNGLPPTWRDLKTVDPLHDECKIY